MAWLPLKFPSQGPETDPRWRLFGAQLASFQEENAYFHEEKWLASERKTRVFHVVYQLNFPLH